MMAFVLKAALVGTLLVSLFTAVFFAAALWRVIMEVL